MQLEMPLRDEPVRGDDVPGIRVASAGVRETLAFFNNHRRGQAVRNAEMFRAMLEARLEGRAPSASGGG